MINMELAVARGISDDDIKRIEECHKFREVTEGAFSLIADGQGRGVPHDIKDLLKFWRANEAELQQLWKFPIDPTYYKEFYIPGCLCPKEDNEMYVGTHYRYINRTCPLHGESK